MKTININKENVLPVGQSLKEKEYWKNNLSGDIEKIFFPHDLNGNSIEMAYHGFEIKNESFNRILSLSKESIPMIYMILVANLKTLLFKYLGENDIIIGSPVEKQNDNKNLINTILPLRSNISNNISYKELLLQVRNTIIKAIENQNYPFETIKNDLRSGQRSNSFNPLFDIAIHMDNLHDKNYLEGSGASVIFSFTKCDDKIEARIEYNSSFYKEETIIKIGELYVQLINQVLFNIDKPFSEISLVSEDEYHSLIFDWNKTTKKHPLKTSIVDVFEEQVKKNQEEIALYENQNTITYKALDEKANQLSNYLKNKKIEKGTVVGILMDRSIDFIISVLGILKAECIFLPIDIASQEDRVKYILEDSGCKLLITNKDNNKKVIYEGNQIIFDSEQMESVETSAPIRTYNEEETAYIIYTSGTTGKPKGTNVLHKGLLNYILWASETYVKGEKLSFPLFTSVAFDLTITSIFTPLVSGGALRIYNRNDSAILIEEILKENKVNVVKLTPSHLKLIRNFKFDETQNVESSIKRFIVGGEQLETSIASEIFANFSSNIEIFNEYGPTEATVGCMIYKFKESDNDIAVPIGKPIDNTQIYLLNRFLEPVPKGLLGDIYISGFGLANGYHKKTELTAAKFIDNPFIPGEKMYKTGDLGRLNDSNNMKFIGRADQQVKIRGFRVELGEIENKIQSYLKNQFAETHMLQSDSLQLNIEEQKRCTKCLLPENYEGATIGEDGVCSICNEFESYKEKAFDYFKSKTELHTLVEKAKISNKSKYDCLLLFSGGKDSTYVLHQLVKMGLKILTFTYDNGYISKQAFDNIENITKKYNVDSVIIESENMKEVLCESLKSYHNVCNGCFKGVNTVGAKIAKDYGINVVVSGLSRGQIFEIKLQGLYKLGIRDADEIDKQLKIFRREYHSMNTKTSRLLDIKFEDDELDNIQFVDYFRYDDIKTRDVLDYLIKVDKSWDKPADTGTSSSNCIINDVGIYVHYKDKGYHFYADQSSWDCRLQTISREEGIEELKGFNPNYKKIGEILNELGYYNSSNLAIVIDKTDNKGDITLCAYFVADKKVDISALQKNMMEQLPDYMVPSYFMQIDKIPLTLSGKVDKNLLPEPKLIIDEEYIEPITETQKKIAEIWSDVLDINIDEIGIHNNFFELGGHSLKATLLISEIEKKLSIKTPLIKIFENPTIEGLALFIDNQDKSIYTALKKVEQKEYYSLSSAQKRLYFLQRMDLESTSYNIPLVVSWGEDVNIDLLNEAFKALIKRHESFRTSFETTNNGPVQKVLDEVSFKMDYFEANNKEEVKSLIDDYIKPFDLSKAPLLRSCIIKSVDDQYIWVVDMHHIISDGTSSTILFEDFLSLYRGNKLKPLKFQYKDFSGWQNNLIESGEIESQKKYWLELYSGEHSKLQLPTDFKRPEVFSFKGDKYKFSLDKADYKKLMEIADKNSATLYMNILAILNILFYKYTGQTDIIIGSGIAGRSHSDLQKIVGMFVNTLAMRNYPEGDKTYLEFLKEVISRSVMAFENQDVQFEDLIDNLKVERDTSRNPLFDINMLVQNFRKIDEGETSDKKLNKVLTLNDIDSKLVYRNITSKFDMTFFVQEQKESVHITLEYYTGIFKKETIERLVFHFKNLIKSVIKNPNTKLKELNIITEEEKKQLLFDFNNTKAAYPKNKTIPELFKEQVSRTPDKTVIVASSVNSGSHSASVGKDIHITFTELDQRSNQLANCLINENNVHPDYKIGIIMDNSPDLIISILGILKSGAAYVPLDPTQPEKKIETIINNSEIEIVISSKKYIRLLNRLQWECENFRYYLCVDSMDVHSETEGEGNELMDIKLWDYIGETSTDEITGGGWNTSYTGEPFSKKEMNEYSDNILLKVNPILNKEMRVLEIGCSSGLSMYKIAPQVGFYYGTDLSEVIIKNNKEKINKEGIKNIKLASIPAHEIDKLDEKGFDLIIMNSVIQSFHGHNYLRDVVNKSVDLLNDKGCLFIGDVMDQDTKAALIMDLVEFQKSNTDKDYRTKTNWSSELFVSRLFFHDLSAENPAILDVKFSKKICTIENELTKFRFDTLITVDKKNKSTKHIKCKNKYQADQRIVERYSTETPVIKLKPNNLAYIIYTSGTSGTPKGVMIEHQSLNNYVSWGIQQYINGNDISFPLYTNFSFDLTATSVYLPLLSGNKIVIYQNSNAQFLIESIVKEDIVDIIKVTPSHLKVLQNSVLNLQSNKRLNKFIVGGEALERQLSVDIEERFNREVDIYNEYGPTEATVGCMIYKFDRKKDDRIYVPIGKPIHNIEVYILDKYLNPLPQGASGELYIAGDSLSRGYINNHVLSGKLFINNPFTEGGRLYKSGDLARFLPDGNIEFLGRIDDQIKIRGYRVELSEIESALLKLVNIKESIVIAREKNGDKQLCAYVVCEGDFSEENMRSNLIELLPDYMVPAYFVELDSLPLTSNGKINRSALPSPEIKAGVGYIAPSNEIEEKLAEIWSEVLHIPKEEISVTTNFFNIGGHSLKASLLVNKIFKQLNIEVPLKKVFEYTDIRGLGKVVGQLVKSEYYHIEKAKEKEYYKLSASQNRLYVLYEFNKESTAYNMPQVVNLGAELDRERLKNVLEHLIMRHETLRTSFKIIDNEVMQKISKQISLDIEYFESTQEELKNLIQNFIRPFDLSKTPLFRVGLVKTDKSDNLMLIDMHHIISDGISQKLMVKDFLSVYNNEKLDELKLQYTDYSEWQHSSKGKDEIKKQSDYWIKEFENGVPSLNIITDYERPQIQSFEGANLSFFINQDQSRQIKEFCQGKGVTEFMFFISIYTLLWNKILKKEKELFIGVGLSGRIHPDIQDVIGFFVNTLPFCIDISNDMPFVKFIENVKNKAFQLMDNQGCQFEDLIMHGDLEKKNSKQPLYEAAFVWQNLDDLIIKEEESNVFGANPVMLDNLGDTSKFDVLFSGQKYGNGFRLNLNYSTKLFKESTIVGVKDIFCKIIEDVMGNVNIPIKSIDVISEDVSSKLLEMEEDNIMEDINFTF